MNDILEKLKSDVKEDSFEIYVVDNEITHMFFIPDIEKEEFEFDDFEIKEISDIFSKGYSYYMTTEGGDLVMKNAYLFKFIINEKFSELANNDYFIKHFKDIKKYVSYLINFVEDRTDIRRAKKLSRILTMMEEVLFPEIAI